MVKWIDNVKNAMRDEEATEVGFFSLQAVGLQCVACLHKVWARRE